ncbi:MAG: DUF4430 domain-containing protein [Niameybacter sp.]|uniref:DUF4430 domain-containing protein n=1 Tax=Niameybacter sp. TaxID=2033640 RepID=UPI002FC9A797
MSNLLPLAALGLLFINKSHPSYRQQDADTIPITFSVLGPKGATILLPPTPQDVTRGDSVLQASIEVFTNQHIAYALSGQGHTSLVVSISDLKNTDYGPNSRWLYKVNGTLQSSYPNDYTLKSGDIVEWVYTTNSGEDLH